MFVVDIHTLRIIGLLTRAERFEVLGKHMVIQTLAHHESIHIVLFDADNLDNLLLSIDISP